MDDYHAFMSTSGGSGGGGGGGSGCGCGTLGWIIAILAFLWFIGEAFG